MAQISDATIEIKQVSQKWQYDIYYLGSMWDEAKVLEVLDSYGKDGWELVSVDRKIAYFKRTWNPK